MVVELVDILVQLMHQVDQAVVVLAVVTMEQYNHKQVLITLVEVEEELVEQVLAKTEQMVVVV